MTNNFSEEYIRREVANVIHPTINCSLVDLGIVKNIKIKTGKVIITMAFPFTEVPVSIKDYLVEMVKESIEEIEKPVEIETVVMTKEELKKFLELEKEHWKKAD
jgi:metal-sulfur cluster biosynthetic enzyme